MTTHVNLMSEKAQFRASARRLTLRWALALGAVVVALVPLGAYAWRHRRGAVMEQEMLEAQYEPIRQLSDDIRRLRSDAENLVRHEKTALELARDRPPATLLALVNAATSDTAGELFIKRLTLLQTPVRRGDQAEDAERLALEATSSMAFDVQRFVKSLQQTPLTEVKLISTETTTSNGRPRKLHGIEASY